MGFMLFQAPKFLQSPQVQMLLEYDNAVAHKLAAS